MEINTTPPEPIQPRLRAMVEIIDGQLKIYAIADTDEQAKQIMDTLLFWKRDA